MILVWNDEKTTLLHSNLKWHNLSYFTACSNLKVIKIGKPNILLMFFFFFFFFLDFGLSRLTSLQFIQYHVAGFYKPTIRHSTPSLLQDYSICNNARLEFSTNFCSKLFDPNEWCLKNGLHSGDSNSQPFSYESSALTTRPRLLAIFY